MGWYFSRIQMFGPQCLQSWRVNISFGSFCHPKSTVLLGLCIKEVASDPSHQPARPVPLSQKKNREINLT